MCDNLGSSLSYETLKNDETETYLCLFSLFYWNGENNDTN